MLMNRKNLTCLGHLVSERSGRFFTMKSIKNLAEGLSPISDYRTRLAVIRSSVASESRILRAALKWGKSLGLAQAPFTGKYECPEGKMNPMD